MFVRHKRSFLFFTVALVAFASAYAVYASSKADIVHPVAELGGCRDEAACRTYCNARDNGERVRACIGFAKKHNLLPPDQLEEAERYAVRLGIAEGPGGCRDTRSCEQYCEDTEHLGECLDFAEKHGLRSAEEIAEGRKLAGLLAQGATLPGGCRTRAACEAYCSEDEAMAAEKIIPLIESGIKTPGNCGRKAACETYCADQAHIDECLAFAEKAGIMSGEELAEAKKFAPLIRGGETPGQCRGRESCVSFGERAGILSAEDAALARKTKGVGPGGCRSKQMCEQFCTDPAHQQECMAFAEQHGLTEEFSGVAAEVRARMEGEGRAKGNAEADAELRTCGEKSCGEMIACLQGVGARSGGGEKDAEGGERALPGDVQEKLNACIAEETARQIREATGSGGDHATPSPQQTPRLPDGGSVGNQSETERRTQEEQQRQYDEEVRRQTEAETKRQTEIQTKAAVDCSLFAAAPKCEYAGPVGSDNYNYCKQCYPEK
ncbi:MAG: hypothetical protein AAB916_02840 [Patescibacteria group bacterium]